MRDEDKYKAKKEPVKNGGLEKKLVAEALKEIDKIVSKNISKCRICLEIFCLIHGIDKIEKRFHRYRSYKWNNIWMK